MKPLLLGGRFFLFVLMVFVFIALAEGQAQGIKEPAGTEEAGNKALNADDEMLEELDSKAPYDPDRRMPSLFFTYWQHRSIADAKNSRGFVRPPSQEEIDAAARGEEYVPDPGEREVILGGIIFRAEDDWVVWMNGKRVTPNSIPKEVLSLQVFEHYIEVKWLDEFTNQVFPIRLRPNQRFNMDQRIFLPG